MKCEEVQLLQGPFLDSELDARSSLQIEQHLKWCAECAHCFDEEAKLAARLRASLNRGQRTAKLWEQIERSLVAAAPAMNRSQPSTRLFQPVGWQVVLGVLGEQLQASWRRSRWAWSGLAGAWMVILMLNLAARETDGSRRTERQLPGSSEVRFAVKQKQLLMTDLAALSEPAPADKARVAPPSPRSDRRKENQNT